MIYFGIVILLTLPYIDMYTMYEYMRYRARI